VTRYALPAIGIGLAWIMIARKRNHQYWGEVIFSLGLIFLGLSTMSSVLKPLKDNQMMLDFLANLGSNPFLGVAIGTLVTVIVQSSSASIGMVIALGSVGLIDFHAALYLLLGDNIGTTITAWLASLNGNIASKRMALIHSLFNVFWGDLFCYFGLYGGLWSVY